MGPEQKARKHIDDLLTAAVWHIQDYSLLNLRAIPWLAVREYPLKTGFADYLLFVNRKVVGPSRTLRLSRLWNSTGSTNGKGTRKIGPRIALSVSLLLILFSLFS